MRLRMVIMLAAVLLLFAGCAGKPEAPGAPYARDVPVGEASSLIQSRLGDREFVLLDVRTPAEFAAGRLDGAVNVDYNSAKFESEINALQKDKTYLVYCATGRRSKGAVEVMQKLGFTSLYNMLGGITKWQADGLPVVK